jgi:hypothetical protein
MRLSRRHRLKGTAWAVAKDIRARGHDVARWALALTTRAIAKALNDRVLKPPRGSAWQAPQIMRLLARLGAALSRDTVSLV